MIRLVKYNLEQPNKNLRDTVNSILETQKVINKNVNIFEWEAGLSEKIKFTNDNKENNYELIIKDFQSKIKKFDGLLVDELYNNKFGNQFYLKNGRFKESLSINYNIGVEKQGFNMDVFYIKNYENYFPNNDKLILFFKQLVEVFNPTHAVITNEDLVYDMIDFKTDEIWTGWMTFISDSIKIDFPEGYDTFEIKGLGKCILTSNKFNIEDKESVEKIIELTNYLRLNGSDNLKVFWLGNPDASSL